MIKRKLSSPFTIFIYVCSVQGIHSTWTMLKACFEENNVSKISTKDTWWPMRTCVESLIYYAQFATGLLYVIWLCCSGLCYNRIEICSWHMFMYMKNRLPKLIVKILDPNIIHSVNIFAPNTAYHLVVLMIWSPKQILFIKLDIRNPKCASVSLMLYL